mmetsp:Transcript_22995/g.20430  ORF Transcript_22995/g.20430 Transcript_22995/m.20430 type:complete len:119 (+) Transcript_22995:43-399(+)
MSDILLTFFNPDAVSDEELATLRRRIFISRWAPICSAVSISGGYFALNHFIFKRTFSYALSAALLVGGYLYTSEKFSVPYLTSNSSFKNSFDGPINTEKQDFIVESNHEVVYALNARW